LADSAELTFVPQGSYRTNNTTLRVGVTVFFIEFNGQFMKSRNASEERLLAGIVQTLPVAGVLLGGR
jgi:hypothetical protein